MLRVVENDTDLYPGQSMGRLMPWKQIKRSSPPSWCARTPVKGPTPGYRGRNQIGRELELS